MGSGNPERDKEIWDRYSRIGSQAAVAREFGVHQTAISQAVARHRATIPAEVREEKIRDELALHEHLRDEVLKVFYARPAPMVAGKDGRPVHDPVDGTVIEDHAGRIAALRAAREISQHLARLGGYEAPTRIDVTATEEAAALAQAEVARRYVEGNS
jgi:DNA-binding transcriptional regulator YdaS (Cro superfamily)